MLIALLSMVALLPAVIACTDEGNDGTAAPTVTAPPDARLIFAGAEYVAIPWIFNDRLSADDLLEVGRASLGDRRVPVYQRKSGERDWELFTEDAVDARWAMVWRPAGVDIAVEHLVQRENVEIVEVREVERVEWADACLGAGRPDEVCAAVITEGFRIILSAAGSEYEYRSDLKDLVRPYPP